MRHHRTSGIVPGAPVTGVPTAEKHSVQRYGAQFRREFRGQVL